MTKAAACSDTLQSLRHYLDTLDGELVELVGHRQAASLKIAQVKATSGRATRDPTREQEVISRAQLRATQLGVPPCVMDEIMKVLIRMSLATQETARICARNWGRGKKALIIGGAKDMGGWFAWLLAQHGFAVEISDPAVKSPSVDWQSGPLSHHYIVVATAPALANATLLELAARRPKGLVFDIAATKEPLYAGLLALRDAGVQVTSLHPLFSLQTQLLADRSVVFVDLGLPQAVAAAQALFQETMVEQVVMSLEQYRHSVAKALNLANTINRALAATPAAAGERVAPITAAASPFEGQSPLLRAVLEQNCAEALQRFLDHCFPSLSALHDASSFVLQEAGT